LGPINLRGSGYILILFRTAAYEVSYWLGLHLEKKEQEANSGNMKGKSLPPTSFHPRAPG